MREYETAARDRARTRAVARIANLLNGALH